MRVLLTGAAHPLGVAAAQTLAEAGHTVRATDTVPQPEGSAFAEYRQGDLTDAGFVAPLLAGVGAIVHLAPLSLLETMPGDAPGEMLDAAARGTHVLLKAAVEGAGGAGATPVVVQGSTLAVMDAYPDDLEVDEQWRPRPLPIAADLAPYLAELTAREFTRDVQLEIPLRIVCLRFAPLAVDGAKSQPLPLGKGRGEGSRGEGSALLSLQDAAQSILRALAAFQDGARRRGHRWQLYHIASLSPHARYTSASAQRALGNGTT